MESEFRLAGCCFYSGKRSFRMASLALGRNRTFRMSSLALKPLPEDQLGLLAWEQLSQSLCQQLQQDHYSIVCLQSARIPLSPSSAEELKLIMPFYYWGRVLDFMRRRRFNHQALDVYPAGSLQPILARAPNVF